MMNHHADLHHGEMHHRTPGISHTTVSGEYLEWRAAPSPLDPLAGDVPADSDLHLDTVRPASPVDPAPRPQRGAAYDSMGLPWNDARRVVEPDEGTAPKRASCCSSSAASSSTRRRAETAERGDVPVRAR